MAFLVSDLDLVRRINRTDLQFMKAYVEIKSYLAPKQPNDLLTIGGGYAYYGGPTDPLSDCAGLGLHGPVTPTEIERVETFYADHRAQAAFQVAPCADPSLMAQLAERGYRLTEMGQVWVRHLEGSLPKPVRGVAVEVCGPSDREAWVSAWLEGCGFPPEYGQYARTCFDISGGVPFWVRVDGRPVAVANMTIRDGVAWFFGTATLPDFRGRGFQTALLQERLRVAQAQGCDLAVVETAVANNSARNCERAGFRVLYTKAKLTK